jgi:hypothetical protein
VHDVTHKVYDSSCGAQHNYIKPYVHLVVMLGGGFSISIGAQCCVGMLRLLYDDSQCVWDRLGVGIRFVDSRKIAG